VNRIKSVYNLVIYLDGGQLKGDWESSMVSASVEDSTELAALAELRFSDRDGKFFTANNVTIGTKVRLAVKPGQLSEVGLFEGEVVTVESQYDGNGTISVVRALDLSHRLMRGQRVRSFTRRTASMIAREVAAGAGVPVGRIDPFPRTYDVITQPNVSDWEFLTMLAVDNNAEAVMADGKFVFRRITRAAKAPGAGVTGDQSPLVVEKGKQVHSVRSTVTSVGQVPSVTVRGWDPVRKKSIKAEVKAAASSRIGIKTTPAGVVRPFGGATGLNITDVPYETDAETRAVAAAVAADMTAALAELEVGLRGTPELRAGVAMSLQRVGPDFDGKYTITSSRHVFERGLPYETWVTVSGRQDRSAYGLAAGTAAPIRPVRVPGLAVGIVTDTKVDADPRSRGRWGKRGDQGWVRLRFPWLTDDSAYQTDWVRTVQLGGTGGGGVFVPEINDEVLVGFEQGLLDRPYVIGGLYNGRDKPSPDHPGALVDPTTGKVNRRSFASRSGDRVELLDARLEPKGIRLATAGDKLVVYLDKVSSTILVDSAGKVEIKAARDIDIRGRNITIDAERDVKITGNSIVVDTKAAPQAGKPLAGDVKI
jgi:phage protein D